MPRVVSLSTSLPAYPTVPASTSPQTPVTSSGLQPWGAEGWGQREGRKTLGLESDPRSRSCKGPSPGPLPPSQPACVTLSLLTVASEPGMVRSHLGAGSSRVAEVGGEGWEAGLTWWPPTPPGSPAPCRGPARPPLWSETPSVSPSFWLFLSLQHSLPL